MNKYFKSDGELLQSKDFFHIAFSQQMQDTCAIRAANKVVFFDSDAVAVQYHCTMCTGKHNKNIDKFVDPDKYDVVLMLTPDTEWTSDRLQIKSEQRKTEWSHRILENMYKIRGFKRIITIDPKPYSGKLAQIVTIVNKLISDQSYMNRQE